MNKLDEIKEFVEKELKVIDEFVKKEVDVNGNRLHTHDRVSGWELLNQIKKIYEETTDGNNGINRQ